MKPTKLELREYLVEVAKKFPGLFLDKTVATCDNCGAQARRLVGDTVLCENCKEAYLAGVVLLASAGRVRTRFYRVKGTGREGEDR